MLQQNATMFSWTSADMPGLDPNVIMHRLSLFKDAKPVVQKKRKLGEERRLAARQEADKLLEAGFIKEAHYTTWLANVVLVKKPSGKWRMCIDYTDLNKACPKDAYPMPSIDDLVDGATGYKFMSFLDAFSGYSQISMHPRDIPKTAFMTDEANYVYEVMPFGLKNAEATYRRLMDRIFKDLIGSSVEVYVDDMVVKSTTCDQHLHDLAKVFKALRTVRMRLNLEKCVFGVEGGKFLGFMLTHKGIEANHDKCKAIMEMQSPQNVKEVQRLVGRVVALSQFMPQMTEKVKPILGLLKKASRFRWDEQCVQAFNQLKDFLSSPPIIQKPTQGQPILVYLSVSKETVSSALVQETQGEQRPVYFASRTLQDAETRYQTVEKVALALVMTARKLRVYFQNHKIVVKNDYPIAKIPSKPDLAGRMVGWAVELSEYGIRYEPRGPIKAQVLADFIVEMGNESIAD